MIHMQWSPVLTVLCFLQFAQHLPLYTDLVQQAQRGDLTQHATAGAYSMLFAEWAFGCSAVISLGKLH